MAMLHSSTGFSLSLARSSPSLHRLRLHPLTLPKIAGFSIAGGRLILLSFRACHYVRRPTTLLSRAGLVKEQIVTSERVLCTEPIRGRKLELKYAKIPTKDFCSFVERAPKEEIVGFFREVAEELEEHRQLQDFHMKVRDVDSDFKIEVYFGEQKPGPELLAPGECISCFADALLYPGMESGECVLEEFSDQPHVYCRLDAKARSGFVITPIRHVERMSQLRDDELWTLWSVAVRALRHAKLPFISMILNHGDYRNLHHLHLKVWVENELHKEYRSTWSTERKELWKRLQELAMNRPRKQQACFFFRRDKYCRHGDLCSFLHVET